jgi:hypothetical protein
MSGWVACAIRKESRVLEPSFGQIGIGTGAKTGSLEPLMRQNSSFSGSMSVPFTALTGSACGQILLATGTLGICRPPQLLLESRPALPGVTLAEYPIYQG